MTTLNIFRGDTINIDVTIQDSNGTAVDITGYTFFFTVKTTKSDKDADAIITKDVTSHTAPASGQTRITLSSTQTAVAVGVHYYDIQMKDTSDVITTIVDGKFIVNQDITIRTS